MCCGYCKLTGVVLCMNDYPIGVYATEELANAAAEVDWKAWEPRWKEQGLTLGQSIQGSTTTHKYMRYYYHQHTFGVDRPARR